MNAEGDPEPAAFFCTCPACEPPWIVTTLVRRWKVEVTFEESRRQLGIATPRQWSDLAIARTTPILLGLFSLVCVMAQWLVAAGAKLTPRTTAWYAKAEATFSNVLALVQRSLWTNNNFGTSADANECILVPKVAWDAVLDQLAATA